MKTDEASYTWMAWMKGLYKRKKEWGVRCYVWFWYLQPILHISNVPEADQTLGLNFPSFWLFVGILSYAQTLWFSFSYWHNENYMVKIIQLYYGKELMFFKHREILQMWLRSAWYNGYHVHFLCSSKRKKHYPSFNHKHRIIKLAMWIYNFCQKKWRKHSKSFICFNEFQNQLLAPYFLINPRILIWIHLLIVIFKHSFMRSGKFISNLQYFFTKPNVVTNESLSSCFLLCDF